MKFENWFFPIYDKKLEKVIFLNYYENLSLINFNAFNFYFQNNNNIKLKCNSFYSETLNFDYNTSDINIFFSELTHFTQANSVDFLYLRKSSFISFFIENMIDVPVCFKKSKSLRYKSFELPLLKFVNLLMRQGKKEKVTKHIFTAFFLFFNNLKLNEVENVTITQDWLDLYFLINNVLKHLPNKTLMRFQNNEDELISFDNVLLNEDRSCYTSFFIKNFFIEKISQVAPIFSYFIYSVDKNIRKYSRGKSGKYTFIWKYVASYKRLYIAFKWILKDIKFNENKIFQNRIIDTLHILMFENQKSFAWKSKTYSYNYVFKNLKKTLMSSLKTKIK